LPCDSNKFIPKARLTIEPIENPLEDKDDDSELAPKRSKRARIANSFGEDFTVYIVDDTPTSIVEAYTSLDAEYWKDIIRSEIDSITANGTWVVNEREIALTILSN
jgi:hypothetical protein